MGGCIVEGYGLGDELVAGRTKDGKQTKKNEERTKEQYRSNKEQKGKKSIKENKKESGKE